MLPELIVIVTALVVLVTDLFLTEEQRTLLAPISMVGVLASLLVMWFVLPHQGQVFGGRFLQNSISLWFKTFFLLSCFFAIALSIDLLDGRAKHTIRGMGHRGEFYTILLFTLSGMMYLTSATDIVTLYVALELATVPLFVLTAWQRGNQQSSEAGLKYVIVGTLASAFILYGLSMMYAVSGHTDLAGMTHAASTTPAYYLGVTLLITGIGFKLALVPFHMWAADVYQGAPAPVTAYLSVASKSAGLAFMFQIFFGMFASHLTDWGLFIAILATLTMSLGNLVAIVQDNIKRFMAFSSISQAGYILLGFLGAYSIGISAMLFYMLVYIFTNLVVFGVIVWYSNTTGRETINDYRGLALTNPLMALAMMLGLFSLAGIPPLSGFVGKFFLFSVAAKAGYHWLVAVAAVNSTISLYYYLRIVRQMYIEPAIEGTDAKALPVTPSIKMTVLVTTAATLLLGIIPTAYESIHNSTKSWSEAISKTAHAAQHNKPAKPMTVVPLKRAQPPKLQPPQHHKNSTKRVTPTKHIVPAPSKRVAPAKRVVPARRLAPAKPAKPLAPTKQVVPAPVPVKRAAPPAKPLAPAKRVTPTKQVAPAPAPAKRVEPAPVKPVVAPVRPVKRAAAPAKPVIAPAKRVIAPAKPVKPVAAPAKPVKPVAAPAKPVKPVAAPVKPVKRVAAPAKPLAPVVKPAPAPTVVPATQPTSRPVEKK